MSNFLPGMRVRPRSQPLVPRGFSCGLSTTVQSSSGISQNSPIGNISSLSESSDSLLCDHGTSYKLIVALSFYLTGRSQNCLLSSTWGSSLSLIRVTNPPPRIRPRFPTLGRPPFQLPTSAGQFPQSQHQSATIASMSNV